VVDRPDVALDDLYREVVMDHHRRPRGRAPLGRVDATAHGFNPVCGDEVVISLALDGDRVTGVQVQGRGCAICTASGSMMAEMIPGHTAAEAEATAEAFRAVMHGAPAPAGAELGDRRTHHRDQRQRGSSGIPRHLTKTCLPAFIPRAPRGRRCTPIAVTEPLSRPAAQLG